VLTCNRPAPLWIGIAPGVWPAGVGTCQHGGFDIVVPARAQGSSSSSWLGDCKVLCNPAGTVNVHSQIYSALSPLLLLLLYEAKDSLPTKNFVELRSNDVGTTAGERGLIPGVPQILPHHLQQTVAAHCNKQLVPCFVGVYFEHCNTLQRTATH